VTLSAIARLLLYTGLMLVLGDATSRWGIARASGGARRTVLAAWLGIVVSLIALVLIQAYDMELDASRAAWQMLLTETAWGRGWSLLAVCAVLGSAAALGNASRAVASTCAVLLAIAMGGIGHAAADDAMPLLARTIDAAHVLGVGVWLGALCLMPSEATLADWRNYSRLASVAAPTVVLSGALASLRRLTLPPLTFGAVTPSWTTIGKSDYAQLLLMKTLLVLVVLGYGLKHRRRVLGEHAPSGKSIRHELVLAFAVLAVTAVLTGTAPPGE
jgi:putative copper export protein